MQDNQLQFTIDLEAIRKAGIFLAIPMYGGQMFGAACSSLIKLFVLCTKYNIGLQYKFLYNESLVQRARNYCAASFMESDAQLMMFIDSDIEFEAQDVLVMAHLMLQNDQYDVLCGPYPKKLISWEKIVTAVNQGFADEDPSNLENFVGDYVINALTGTMRLNEPTEIAESGTGFMMIKRSTFEAFEKAYPEQAYRPDHIRTKDYDGSKEIFAYFDCPIDPETKRYLSEDYYFCSAIRKIGKKVFLAPWVQLKHHGYYTYGGSLAALAAINATPTADPTKIKKK